MVDIARVHARIRGGNGVRLPPQSFTVEKPSPLTLRQVGTRGSLILHNMRMMPQPADAGGKYSSVRTVDTFSAT